MLKVKIADTVIDYSPAHTSFFKERFSDYIVSDVPALVSASYTICNHIDLPEITNVKEVNGIYIGTLPNGNTAKYTTLKDGTVFFLAEHSKDYSKNIFLSRAVKPEKSKDLTNCDREYLELGNIFKQRLIYEGGTVLHGSCISYKGEGIIFSAPSGTGKSTHASLWKREFSQDVEFLNDDKPALRIIDGKAYCYGTPFSGKTTLNSNKKAPLKAIVFIKRGKKNKIYSISTAEAVCFLADQTCPSVYDNENCIKNLNFIDNLLKCVKIFALECNISPKAAHLAKDTIFTV